MSEASQVYSKIKACLRSDGGATAVPAAAMSLNKGCEESPSKRKGGWEAGAGGAGAGPPERRKSNTRVHRC